MSNITELQKSMCVRFQAKFMACDDNSKVGIALQTLDRIPLHALRHPPKGGTNGWYIWAGEYSDDADFFQPLHYEHLHEYLPILLPYLGLGPGWRILLSPPDHEDVWYDPKLLEA